MANKRMFSKQIVSSDDFLDMPLTTQALYFHLALNADDDGFVAPKSIMRLTRTSEDDLKVLITKEFIIPFENRVVVVVHWKLHNYLQNDRYTPTEYVEYKSQITCNVSKMYTRRIPDKISKGKNRSGKGSLVDSKSIRKKIKEGMEEYISNHKCKSDIIDMVHKSNE